MLDVTFSGAVLAGLLSFFSPCILPMVPFYLSYMAGASVSDLRAADAVPVAARRKLVMNSVAFALGVTTIFVLMGFGATAAGRAFAQWRDALSILAGAVLILFGLHFLGLFKIGWFYREAKLAVDIRPSTLIGAYVTGLAFGFGWTPCVGPALAAILMVASGMGEVWRGGLLLLVYGLSMTLPFVIAALFAAPFLAWVARNRRLMAHVEKVMGAVLIVFGLLIATGSVNLISDWLLRTFDWSATLK
jgi:cytochrome c-type biogenesis protein